MKSKLTFFIALLLTSNMLLAQTSRTEYVTEFDKKQRKEITYKDAVLTYNDKGDVVEEWNYDKKGNISKHIKFTYNAQNKKLKEIHYSSKGKEKKIVEYTYDDKGRKILEKHIDADTPTNVELHKFVYDEKK
ncbi:MAG: hypothetical protein RI955_745 [Bacteroidota bacterium]|jgi:Spy/CpxP family protein refolding chaperone